MEFHIDKNSSIPIIAQIEEQIKLAIAMGTFRKGDTLPSIRDVEKETGVNRGVIHRAYLSLRQSGLLALKRGKGTVVAASISSNHVMNRKCLRLSESVISKVSQFGVSPTAFGRYLSRKALAVERDAPLIAFVDSKKAVAERRSAEISRLWQVPVIGLSTSELKKALRKNPNLRKALCNHLNEKYIRSLNLDRKIDVIPIEVTYSEETIKDLSQIKSHSHILRVLAPPYIYSSRFIISQLRNWVRATDVEISAISARDISSYKKLLDGTRYDRVIVDRGVLANVPQKLQRSRRLLMLRFKFESTSLENARIRAGVII